MNIMHIVNCWWIPRIRMIHGLAYTQYWYAPCLSNNDVVFTPVKCDICAFRSCCSASNATKFFNSIDAVILHHVKDLIECSWEVSRCFIYGHSGINIIIIIILINMMMIQLLKCIIETLMCGGTMVAMTTYCDNVIATMSLSSMIHLHHYLSLPYLVVVFIVLRNNNHCLVHQEPVLHVALQLISLTFRSSSASYQHRPICAISLIQWSMTFGGYPPP